jgi:hypothetical protein
MRLWSAWRGKARAGAITIKPDRWAINVKPPLSVVLCLHAGHCPKLRFCVDFAPLHFPDLFASLSGED